MLRTVFILTVLMTGIGCSPDAPHENPLDPFHQSFSENQFTFRGQVLQKNPPHNPLSGCLIFLQPEKKYTQADEQGRFEFISLQNGEHQAVIIKPGFDSTLIAINFDTLTSASIPFYLNGKPFLKSAAIYSEYIDQWWPDPRVFLLMSISVGDPDGIGDLKELRLEIPGLNLSFPFSATAKTDSFYLRLDELQFPENSLFPLVGQETKVVLIDASDSKITDATYRLLRIINTSPLTKTPTGLQTISATPTFVWEPYLTTFTFSYEISVFVISAGIPLLIHRKKLPDDTQTRYVYPASLSSGTYFWTIGIRDKFGNFSRSKEASFLVQ
ncbi:MAG TPA: hypothetical protein ENH29_02030 [Bacteroidetes bacterium]|nr:hypothetical protein [Bacteroidota bacterium]